MQKSKIKSFVYIISILLLITISLLSYKFSNLKSHNDNLILAGSVVVFLIFLYLLNYIIKSKNTQLKAPALQDIESKTIFSSRQKITLADVAGMDDVKVEIKEIIDFLKDPAKYRDFGIKLPKGLLLVGPPGVGKTMIAKAIAGESDLPFFYQSGASFVNVYVGMGAKRVRELFESAKSKNSAIIFIDEIDAVGKSRGGGNNEEREATLNQLLVEMDGFEDSSNIMVIAATNQIEVLDEALLRPGRFDRRIYIPLPNIKERCKILKLHLRGKKYQLSLDKIASISAGFSSATLSTWVNEAAINALRRESSVIELFDFESVKNRVISGIKRETTLNEKQKIIQSYYQSAKIFCATKFGIDYDKITIFDKDFGEKENPFQSKKTLINLLQFYLSGKEATKILNGDDYSNAKDDIFKAKELAKSMVQEFGMGESISIDSVDIVNLLDLAQEEVSNLIKENQIHIEDISKLLLKNESITKKEVMEIIN